MTGCRSDKEETVSTNLRLLVSLLALAVVAATLSCTAKCRTCRSHADPRARDVTTVVILPFRPLETPEETRSYYSENREGIEQAARYVALADSYAVVLEKSWAGVTAVDASSVVRRFDVVDFLFNDYGSDLLDSIAALYYAEAVLIGAVDRTGVPWALYSIGDPIHFGNESPAVRVYERTLEVWLVERQSHDTIAGFGISARLDRADLMRQNAEGLVAAINESN
jgi:hypothetical protein